MKETLPQLQKSLAALFEEAARLSESGNSDAAIHAYQRWLGKHKDSQLAHAAYFNLGVLQADSGKLQDAEQSYRDALKLQPGFLQAMFNLGSTLEKLQRFDEALACWKTVSALPDSTTGEQLDLLLLALNSTGRMLENRKQYADAEVALTRSLLLKPEQPNVIHHWVHLRQKQCNWPVLKPLPGLSASDLLDATSALAMLDVTDDPALQLAAAERYINEKVLPGLTTLAAAGGYGHKKLRIGYLSSDFSLHPVSMLTVEMLELHDRERFEVYGFCWSPKDGSALRQRMIEALDVYVPIGDLSDQEAAERIRAAEIDILVDLQGLTSGARINILARRPAPVQVAYLGFPGTSGMPFIDYVLCDKYVVPESVQAYFTEKPLYLPEVFQVCDRKRPVAATPTRAECGLPDDAIVFCAFNNNHKYTPELFEVWIRILQRVPNSVLWLLADNPSVQPNLRAFCSERGVDDSRLIFAPRVLPPEYLARFRQADLFLDCFPFNGGTTANDALWMGLPIVTCSGRTFASRMAGSLLHSLGLPELVVDSFEQYEQLAVDLALNPERLGKIKGDLLVNREKSAVFKTDEQVRQIEKLFLQVAAHDPELKSDSDCIEAAVMPALAKEIENKDDRPYDQNIGEKMSTNKTFLHVGCGPLRKESTTRGFNTGEWSELRLDINEAVKPDIVGTMTDMSRVGDASVDAIFSSHNIEHLFPHDVPLALQEFMRVLNADGFAVITCPDLKSVCALVADDKLTDPAYMSASGPIAPIDILYGHRPAMAMGNLYMAHRCGFTEKVLSATLQAAGFATVITLARPANFDLWAVASKSARSEDEMRALAALHFIKP